MSICLYFSDVFHRFPVSSLCSRFPTTERNRIHMALDRDAALEGAVAWIRAIRERAHQDGVLAITLLDTCPENISLAGLIKATNDPGRLTAEEKRLITVGSKIPAIKSIRERTGLGLREA